MAAQGAALGSVVPGIGTAIGAVVGGIAGAIFGKKKKPAAVAPAYVDPAKALNDTLSTNSNNVGKATKLSREVNSASQAEATRLLEQAIPGIGSMLSKMTQQANSDLDSQYNLPPEISANLERLAAEKGIARGTSGNFNSFSLLRDFGLNMMDYSTARRMQAMSTLNQVYNMAPRINPMSPASFLLSPQAVLGAQQFNEAGRYNAAVGAAQASADASNYNRGVVMDGIGTALGAFGAYYDGRAAARTAANAKGPKS